MSLQDAKSIGEKWELHRKRNALLKKRALDRIEKRTGGREASQAEIERVNRPGFSGGSKC